MSNQAHQHLVIDESRALRGFAPSKGAVGSGGLLREGESSSPMVSVLVRCSCSTPRPMWAALHGSHTKTKTEQKDKVEGLVGGRY